ncbi:hypothetical protein LXA43DRAFT_38340 [Ganoderma leucocontextum]|nr:hypothetical protein LXA43DRAFT_38340 [Ganoderma leucocontextum]
MAEDARSTKRRRVSSRHKTIVLDSSTQANGQEKLARSADFWLDDGNLILLAGETAFRVYKGILTKNSGVFADMFAAGSADATESFDGCPVVRLSDDPEDLGDFLQHLMLCSPPRVRDDGLPLSYFSNLQAAIHLAHKYQCPDVEKQALAVLKTYYTAFFADHASYDASRSPLSEPLRAAAIAAVNIARLTDTRSMLPFALYQVCTLEGQILDGYERRDGSVEHLSGQDLRLCLDARSALAREKANLLKAVTFMPDRRSGCEWDWKCTDARRNVNEAARSDMLGDCDVLDAHSGAIEAWAENFGVCSVCKREMLQREDEEQRRVWMLLPDMFGLTVEDCGFTE